MQLNSTNRPQFSNGSRAFHGPKAAGVNAATAMAPPSHVFEKIIQSPSDAKQYRHVTLANEMQVLLVHDPSMALSSGARHALLTAAV